MKTNDTKHTPGPWIHGEGNTYFTKTGQFMTANLVYGPGGYSGPWIAAVFLDTVPSRSRAEMEANARLIAAAPELLAFTEAAAGFIAWAHDSGADKNAMIALEKMRRAAIAKATGQS